MRILKGKSAEAYIRAVERRGLQLRAVEPTVRAIVEDVRSNGDRALRKYGRRFDQLKPKQDLRVSPKELSRAWKKVSAEFKTALRCAEKNIRQFCEWQKPQSWTRSLNGISVGQIVQPLGSVGCYVPGGRFPLVSTLMMTVIPAQVAGVKRICVTSPNPTPELLSCAAMLGVREFYRIGGAQAIAGLAYGTETLARVDKIVGPGNVYVTATKKLVAFDSAIDMLAGPTESVIVSDRGNPRFIAADLIAQAEHDPDTLAIFISQSQSLARDVQREIHARNANGHSGHINAYAKASLSLHGAILVPSSRSQAFEWTNRIAPEHVTVDKKDLGLVQNAGSIFVGDYSAQAAGDYASGPNHVLPTGGAARFRGGLSVMDFVKLITVQELSPAAMQSIAPTVVRLAEAEGLHAHAESIRVRCANA